MFDRTATAADDDAEADDEKNADGGGSASGDEENTVAMTMAPVTEMRLPMRPTPATRIPMAMASQTARRPIPASLSTPMIPALIH